MKIVQVIDRFHLAGGQIMCGHLSIELKKAGHDIVVVSLYSMRSAITELLENNGIKVVCLDKKKGADFSVIGKLRRTIKEESPDVVHTHLGAFLYCACAMLWAKTKLWIHTVHTLAQREAPGIRGIVSGICFRRHRPVPVALSITVQNSIAEKYHMDCAEIPVVFNGIDLSRCVVKSDYSFSDSFTLIHIGRFCEVKNHIGLIRAFALFHRKYPDSQLHLVGDGELRREIETYVEESGLADSVKFLGLRDNVYPLLHEADAFVLPSLAEGIPIAMIEAMGTGLPVVATSVGGVPDMLEDGVSALLCEVEDEKIAACFEKYYLDEKLREKHGKAALERSKAFSAEEMARKYLDVYKRTE